MGKASEGPRARRNAPLLLRESPYHTRELWGVPVSHSTLHLHCIYGLTALPDLKMVPVCREWSEIAHSPHRILWPVSDFGDEGER